MNPFMQQTSAYPVAVALPWLAGFQRAQAQQWLQSSFPNRKTESWKYTNLRALEQGGYFAAPRAPLRAANGELALPAIEGLAGVDLVFVNGEYCAALSSAGQLPPGLNVCRFSSASAEQQQLIGAHLGQVAGDSGHLFNALNGSQFNDGLLVHIGKNTRVEQPLRVVWFSTRQAQPFAVAQRLLVIAEEGSEATVVEQFASSAEEQNVFTSGVSELQVNANAQLFHYRLHQEQENALHIGGVHTNLARGAILNSFHLALGSTLKRIDVLVNHRGEGAHCEINGVYLPRGKQLVDYHTCVEHAVPHCTTNEVFRGIIADSAKAVFNGRIHIHPQAQKTSAQLSNKNLLTSNKAEVDTKPELEIYADDVQCAHGATVAQLDEKSLHYLRTRGVGEDEARVMLSFGFINELINGVRNTAIAGYLRPQLAALFARDPELLRHIGS